MSLWTVSGKTTGSPSDLDQVVDAMTGNNDVDFTAFVQLSPPSAPTVSVVSTAGNLTGDYQYALAFQTGYWQGPVGIGTLHPGRNTGGGAASVTISPNGQQASVDIPEAPTGVVNVLVYRTKANGSIFYYLTSVQSNTSMSIPDNTPDSELGAEMPSENTTGGKFIGDGSQLTDLPASQLQGGPIPASVLPPADTTTLGTMLASANPEEGDNPIGVVANDPNYQRLTGGTSSVADSEHTHQKFPEAVTFSAGAYVSGGDFRQPNYSLTASSEDSNNHYTVTTYKRTDGSLYMTSTLSGTMDANGNYPTMTNVFYKTDGATVDHTDTWTLTYDANGALTNSSVVTS